MSISCNKFVGYSMNIMKEIEDLDTETKNDIIYDLEKGNKYGLSLYWGSGKLKTGDIVILYDGLSGEYAKLLYVVAVSYDAYEDDTEYFTSSIQELLKKVEVPNDVRTSMLKVYYNIFGNIISKEIITDYIVHYQ